MDNEIQVTVASDDSQGFTVGDGVNGVVPHEDNPAQDVEKPQLRNKNRSSRAEQLRQENAALAKQNEELARALEQRDYYLETQSRIIDEQKKQAEESELEQATSTLDEREKTILGQMKYAKEEGLVDDELMLTKELSKIQADRSALSLLTDLQENDTKDETYFRPEIPYSKPQVAPKPQYPDAFYDYLDRNPDLNPSSDRFNAQKLAEAEEAAANVTDLLIKGGNQASVGTPIFYEAVDLVLNQSKHRASTLGVAREDQLYDVTPSGVRNISKEELSFIRNLPVYLDDGTEASEQQKIERYLNAGKNIQYRQSGSTRVI